MSNVLVLKGKKSITELKEEIGRKKTRYIELGEKVRKLDEEYVQIGIEVAKLENEISYCYNNKRIKNRIVKH